MLSGSAPRHRPLLTVARRDWSRAIVPDASGIAGEDPRRRKCCITRMLLSRPRPQRTHPRNHLRQDTTANRVFTIDRLARLEKGSFFCRVRIRRRRTVRPMRKVRKEIDISRINSKNMETCDLFFSCIF